MGFIPSNTTWFLADLVVARSIEDDPRTVVHINTVLVRADSAEEAYLRATEIGREEEHTYENTDGKLVTVVFRGLRELAVIHDELEHGAGLMYRERVVLTEEELGQMETPKEWLSVFAPRKASSGPNYMPGSVMDMLGRSGFSESEIAGEES